METNSSGDSKDMLYLVGGLALLIAGAGLILSHPQVQKTVRGALDRIVPGIPDNLTGTLATVVPDFQRYMKLRSM